MQEITTGFAEVTTRGGDLQQGASAAQAAAAVQAKYVMAMQRPRNMVAVENKLLAACERPGFALTARYARPVGKDRDGRPKYVTGWSIRFAEECVRALGNVDSGGRVLYDDAELRVVEFAVTDLENNIHYATTETIPKTVERHSAEGRTVVGERTNSGGKRVFIVAATADEIRQLEGVLRSKAWRLVVRLVPGDILDACEARIAKTLSELPADKIIEAMLTEFAKLNLGKTDLEAFLGHALRKDVGNNKLSANCSPAELELLRDTYRALRDGNTTWDDVMAKVAGSREEAERVAAAKIAAMQLPAGSAKTTEGAGQAGLKL